MQPKRWLDLEALNFRFRKERCRENRGADQLCGYCTSDLHLNLFSHMQNAGFLMTRVIFTAIALLLVSAVLHSDVLLLTGLP